MSNEAYQSYLFIINVLSGNNKNRETLARIIQEEFIDAEVFLIKSKSDFETAIQKCRQDKFKYVIVNGGDGTINTFIQYIIPNNKVLGILPSGSGNGLARTLGISLNTIEALKMIKKCNIQEVDVGKINDRYFACAIGFGIDAAIAKTFETQKLRGLLGYILASVKTFLQYRALRFTLNSANQQLKEARAFILSVLNIPQYGNDFYLAPSAKINDGLLNTVYLGKISFLKYPYVMWNLLRKKEKHPIVYTTQQNLTIEILSEKFVYHIDGEPIEVESADRESTAFNITVINKKLKIIV